MMNVSHMASQLAAETPDGVLISDRDGIIRFWNGGCERIFGFSASEAIGESLEILIPDNLRDRHQRGHDETMRTGHTRFGAGDLLSVPALRKNGARISVEFSITPFRDQHNGILALAAIMRDVTERFNEMKTLRRALADAHKSAAFR